MSALRKTGETSVQTTEAPFTVLLHEALSFALDEDVRREVMREAGWDEARGTPTAESTNALQWIDTHLFPRLAERVGLKTADELRRQARALVLNAANSGTPATPREGAAIGTPRSSAGGSRSSASGSSSARASGSASAGGASGVRPSEFARAKRSSAARPTQAPRVGATSVLVLSTQRSLEATLDRALAGRATVSVLHEIEELTGELQTFAPSASVIVLDLRGRDARALRALDGEALAGQQVLVWGVPTLDTPELQRVVREADRSIGCTDEAEVADVAGLCAALLGLND